MTIMTERTNNFGWVDPYSEDYRPEIIQLIENVAVSKSQLARNVWHIEVDPEDIVGELYAHLIAKPNLLLAGKVPSKILHNIASNFCFKQRTDQGAAILGTDSLHGIMQDFNSMPTYIREIMYGPVFAKAGKPVGSYLEAIEQEYKYGNKIVGASNRRTLARAVTRLAEVISGIMVGTPDSLAVIENSPGIPTYLDEADEDFEDPTFAPFTGIYYCDQGHKYRINTGDKPDNNKIGKKQLLGYLTCRCGNTLTLDSRD